MSKSHTKQPPRGVLTNMGNIRWVEMPATPRRSAPKRVPELFWTDTENLALFLDERAGLGIIAPAQALMNFRVKAVFGHSVPYVIVRVPPHMLQQCQISPQVMDDPRPFAVAKRRKAALLRRRLAQEAR